MSEYLIYPVNLDKDTHKKLKIQAAEKDLYLKDYIKEILKKHANENTKDPVNA